MDSDTNLGGPAAVFPATCCSLVRDTANPDAAIRKLATETLISAYWKPIYKYIRIKWKQSNEDAKDLTQAFFALALEKAYFDRFDPDKARFRTFVRLCVDRFVGKGQRAEVTLKRGGAVDFLSVDFASADEELRHQAAAPEPDPDAYFRQEWVRGLFAFAVEDLRRQCAEADKDTHFALFQRYDLESRDASADGLTYARLAEEFGLSTSQVTNYLASARRQFRQLILDRLAAATGSDEEFQHEARRLFGEQKQ
jgi:RNA polymerase sigma factor (sigma-70 family)